MSPKNPGDIRQADITVPQKGFAVGRNFSGWCFVMKRLIWEKIGGLDEDFSFWCADNATVEQLKAIQVQPVLIPSSQVKHFASATLQTLDKAAYVEKTKMQILKFNRKYNPNLFNPGK
jgi:GT2 family glycosyltransferase